MHGKTTSRKNIAKTHRKKILVKLKDNFQTMAGMIMVHIENKIKGSEFDQIPTDEGIKRFGAEAVSDIIAEFKQLDDMSTAKVNQGRDIE